MRSIKELLEILAHEYENNKDNTIRDEGLCLAIKRLTESHGVFDLEERVRLNTFIYEHRPDLNIDDDYFWWDTGVIYPRIKFLTRLINKL